MIKFSPLFSGSKGNCTLVEVNGTRILLDLGYGYNGIVSALARRGISPEQIDGIVVTHEHSDHVSALTMWSRYYNTPVYLPQTISHEVINKTYSTNVVELDGSSFAIGNASVDVYTCSHDAKCCYGYRFGDGHTFVASVTDTGTVEPNLVTFLSPCTTIQLESNHDVTMLKNGPYPFPLKQRILSDYGHLSNAQTGAVLEQVLGGNVKNLILAHLSEQNNTPELAFASALAVCNKKGVTEGKDVCIYVANQHKNGVTFEH